MTNNDTDEEIIIQNSQGAADDSIKIESVAGGITLKAYTISLDGVVVSNGTLVKKTVVYSNYTASNSTFTIDMLLGGLILRNPNGADRIDSLPTAKSIISGILGAVVGS